MKKVVDKHNKLLYNIYAIVKLIFIGYKKRQAVRPRTAQNISSKTKLAGVKSTPSDSFTSCMVGTRSAAKAKM